MIAEKLKKSILQEAIQGRLVPQNPEDEPASALLEKIRKEKKELVKAGKISADKQEVIIFRGSDNIKGTISGRFYERIGNGEPIDITKDFPFEIPDSWEWVRIGYFTKAINGKAFKPSDWTAYGLPIVRIQNLNDINAKYNFYAGKVDSKFLINNGDLLFAWSGTPGTSFGAHIWEKGKAILNQHIFKLEFEKSLFYKQYYAFAINQQVDKLIKQAHGAVGLQHITKSIFENTFIPVPPIEEQKRIVSTLDDLLPKVSEYQKIETKIHQVNISFPDKFKKSVLQAAIQGKLVPQNPDEEPASVLLEKIRAEKRELVKAGKIKADKQESVIFRGSGNIEGTIPCRFYERIGKGKPVDITEDLPFAIPDSWEWVRLGSILKSLNDGTHTTPKYVSKGIPFLSVKNISSGKIDFSNCKYITEEEHKILYKRCNPEFGDILLTKVGTTGIPVLVNTKEQFSLFVSVALLKIFSFTLNPYFLIHVINSPLVQYQAKIYTKGVGNQNWVIRDIAKTLFPLPPLFEQHRIVDTIDMINKKIDVYSYE